MPISRGDSLERQAPVLEARLANASTQNARLDILHGMNGQKRKARRISR